MVEAGGRREEGGGEAHGGRRLTPLESPSFRRPVRPPVRVFVQPCARPPVARQPLISNAALGDVTADGSHTYVQRMDFLRRRSDFTIFSKYLVRF